MKSKCEVQRPLRAESKYSKREKFNFERDNRTTPRHLQPAPVLCHHHRQIVLEDPHSPFSPRPHSQYRESPRSHGLRMDSLCVGPSRPLRHRLDLISRPAPPLGRQKNQRSPERWSEPCPSCAETIPSWAA